MGIIQKIKNFMQKREASSEVDSAISGVQETAGKEMYNQASMKAFYAIETMSEAFFDIEREDHLTAREFVDQLNEEGHIGNGELDQLILNFEVAKYSQAEVDKNDYSKGEKELTTVVQKVKGGKVGSKKKKKRRRRRRKRKPRKGRRTGASKSKKKKKRSKKKKDDN